MTDWTRVRARGARGAHGPRPHGRGHLRNGRLARVAGPIDQLVFEGVLQPVLLRLHGGRWRLAGGWHNLEIL